MNIVTMTIKRKHFDNILNGSKTVEYRQVKPYWDKRLSQDVGVLKLIAGYRKDSPRLIVGVDSIVKTKTPDALVKSFGPEVWAIHLGQADLL